MKRRTLFSAACAIASLSLSPFALAQTQWDMATAYPAFNFHTQNNVQFAKDVQAATNGALDITVHSGASLFKAPEIKRAVQGGQAQVGEFFMVSFQNEWPLFGLDGLPFLASSWEDARKLYEAQKPALEKKLDQQNMVLLYSVAWPPQGIYTKQPITSAADLKGMKWRVYSPTTARIGELLGAQPVTIQEAELSQALATGVVDGLISSSATGADNKLYEHLKYYYNVQAWIPKNAVVVNKRAFNALDADTQAAVRKAAAEAEARGWEAAKAVDAKSIATLQDNGMVVEPGTEQLRRDLAALGQTIVQEWLNNAGDDGKTVLDAFHAAR